MSPAYSPILKHNLRIYNWIKVFTKRVYLPLTFIYMVEVGHLSLAQIGALAIVSALTSIAAGIPTGYYADRVKRKTAIAIGASLIAVSILALVLLPNFVGAVIFTVVESLGYSFISGAGEALMHDTMVESGQTDQYVKIMGRAQSFGLISNVVLISLVPLTYSIDKRLPFILGCVAALTLTYLAISLDEPKRTKPPHLQGGVFSGLAISLRSLINYRTIWIFLAIGLMSAFYVTYAKFITLVLKDLGIIPSLLGLVYAAASILGAIGGWYIHYLKRIPLLVYGLFDVFMGTFTMVMIGLTHNAWVAVVFALVNMGFWRLRSIIYQDNLLRAFGHHGSKATLISALSFFSEANEIWLPLIFVAANTSLGFYQGFVILGVAGFVIMSALYIIGVTMLTRSQKVAPA